MTMHPSVPESTVLPRGVRTFKPRRSRITPTAARALVDRRDALIPLTRDLVDLDEVFGTCPVVLEIGFGDGRATAQMAAADPLTGVLAVDVHTPGVGALLHRIDQAGLTNVRVVEGDALIVLHHMIPERSLAGVRTYFPDPWPKARHHKRRLVQPPVVDLIRSRLAPGGWWHLATDWDAYVDAIVTHVGRNAEWTGGVVPRPAQRPVTHYEERAVREGRPVTDLVYRTRPA